MSFLKSKLPIEIHQIFLKRKIPMLNVALGIGFTPSHFSQILKGVVKKPEDFIVKVNDLLFLDENEKQVLQKIKYTKIDTKNNTTATQKKFNNTLYRLASKVMFSTTNQELYLKNINETISFLEEAKKINWDNYK